MPMPSARSASPAARRYGRPRRSAASATATTICRCLPVDALGCRATGSGVAREPDVALPPMPLGEEVVNDYRFLHLSLRAHPAQFLRADLNARGIVRNEALRRIRLRHARAHLRAGHLPAAARLGQRASCS